jgi:anti-anti-sigma factor
MSQLDITQTHHGEWTTIEISGPLHWPDAARLSDTLTPPPTHKAMILLDLTAVTSIDNTGIALLASLAAHLHHSGHDVRLAITNEQIRRQLPRTAGLHNIFINAPDALDFGPRTRQRQQRPTPPGDPA